MSLDEMIEHIQNFDYYYNQFSNPEFQDYVGRQYTPEGKHSMVVPSNPINLPLDKLNCQETMIDATVMEMRR